MDIDAPSPEPFAGFDDLEASGYGTPAESFGTVYGLSGLVPVVAVAVLLLGWWRARKSAAAAEALEQGGAAPPAEGDWYVRGRVVESDGGDAPVRVVVEQRGSERKHKGRWTHSWEETSRTVTAHPFVVETPSGARVRIEPGPSPHLVDELDAWMPLDQKTRRATASLDIGEHVSASGIVTTGRDPHGGYRGGGSSLVLKPKQGEPMLLSTGGLAQVARERAQRFRRWAIGVLSGALVAQAVALPFHLAVGLGLLRQGVIIERWTNPLSEGGVRHSVRVDHGYGPPLVEEIEAHDYDRLAPDTQVPIHVSPLQTTLGPHPTIYAPFALIPAFALGVLITIALVHAHRRTAWHEKPLRETREGRL